MRGQVLASFLFTDLVGSSTKWERDADAMSAALARHDRATSAAVERAGGVVFDHRGDGVAAVFDDPVAAALAAVALQRALIDDEQLVLRAGIHVGLAEHRDGNWFGPALNRCARVMDLAAGRQILASEAAATIISTSGADGLTVRPLAHVRLRGMSLPDLVHQIAADGLPDAFPPLIGQSVDSLPRPLTSFVGRAAELAEITELLDHHRVVTLAGVGGTGKTRLAIEAARTSASAYPDGVMFAALAEAADADGVIRAVMEAADLVSGDGLGEDLDQQELVLRALRGREALLVLDNCEHLVDPIARFVASLLQRSSSLRILTTSREPLGIGGEHVWRVPTLDDESGIVLLVERAQAHDAHYVLRPEDRDDAVELLRRLDGLPLAIELAAARLRSMSVHEALSRLDDRFQLLAGRGRTHDRHSTLRATLDWSYALLSPDEQLLLERLSVFVGGATLAGIEAVCSGGVIEAGSVLDLVEALIDKSLVSPRESDSATRFEMLETVRSYAAERLASRGEASASMVRHQQWVERLAQEYAAVAFLSWEAEPMLPLVDETDNAQAALDWAVRAGQADAALSIASALTWLHFTTGRAMDGVRWCETALSTDGGDPLGRYGTESLAAFAANIGGDPDAAWRHALRAIELSDGDPTLPAAFAWRSAMIVAVDNVPDGAPSFVECLTRFRALGAPGDAFHEAYACLSEGIHDTRMGRLEEAERVLERASRGLLSSDRAFGYALIWLGLARFLRHGSAGLTSDEVTRLLSGSDPVVALNLSVLRAVESAGGADPSMTMLVEVVREAVRSGLPTSFTLNAAAAAVAASGDHVRAARLLGAAGPPARWVTHSSTLADHMRPRVRAALGDVAYERHLAEGARLTESEAIELAVATRITPAGG